MNGVQQEQLLFVGTEITYLLQLIDETPTKYGKNFLTLVTAVRNKRAQEQQQAQAEFFRQQQEAQAAFNKKNKDGRPRKKKADPAAAPGENTEGRV